jgi:hypothetical protein
MKYQKRKRNRCPLGDCMNVSEVRKEMMESPTVVGVNTTYFADGTKTAR